MKSLISKFTSLFVVSVILVFFMLFFGLNKVLANYFVEEKMKTLLQHGNEIQRAYLEESVFVTVKEQELLKEIRTLSYYFDETIWLVDQRGYIYVSKEESTSLGFIEEAIDPKEIETIMSGEIIQKKYYQSDFFDDPVLVLGRPIINENNDVRFALYIHVAVPEVLETRVGVLRILAYAFFFGVSLVALIIYLASRKVSRDLKLLNKSVEAVASGKFNEPLKTKRKDEIGQLTLNTQIMADNLKAAEVTRRQFISDVSHDFRSPLGNIIGFSKGLLDGTIEEDSKKKYLGIIVQESERLLTLSNDILMLSKLQQPMTELEEVKLDIESMLLNILDTFETQIEEKGIHVKLYFNLENKKALGDEKLMKRAFHNLIHNSIKFNVIKGCLKIETKVQSNKIKVIISNETHEIISDDVNKLFDRFYKGDLSRGIEKSSGLGLAIVKEIFDAHENSIVLKCSGQEFKVLIKLDVFS